MTSHIENLLSDYILALLENDDLGSRILETKVLSKFIDREIGIQDAKLIRDFYYEAEGQ